MRINAVVLRAPTVRVAGNGAKAEPSVAVRGGRGVMVAGTGSTAGW